ncbi:MAG: TonB-dependent receptor [Sphingomonadales bacterium]|nr:TonB-dependent receptor [Sphingomonadales bacterium]MDE2569778.1 TonB-dependent receptor [Sphingomonadales bacterium]
MAGFAGHATAQTADQQATKPQDKAATAGNAESGSSQPGGDDLGFNEIVVTASPVGQTKFKTAYAIATVSDVALTKLAPLSTADLIGTLPGVFAESSGGEASNVYRVRGIPNEGSFQAFQEDGMPIYPESAGFFFTGDGLQRTDIMTEQYEAVLGGPAPIYATNASAIYNEITRQGGDQFKGSVRATIGDSGLYRGEGYVSGPIGPRTYYAIGGFYRYNRGYRDNGFPSDKGGQFRLNLRHEFDTVTVKAHFKYFNDQNIFYLPIPLADPRDPSRSLNQFVDFFDGTLNTPALADGHAVMKYANPDGTLVSENRSLSDGRKTRYIATGMEFDFHPGGGLHVLDKFRYTKGKVSLDALYSSSNPVVADTYAAGYLKAAQAAFGPGVTRIGYALAGSNGLTAYDPNSQSGLVVPAQYRDIHDDFESFQNDFTVNLGVDFAGRHDLTLGVNIASFKSTGEWRGNDYLLQLKSQPGLLDLVAYDAAGAPVGFITDNGTLKYSSTLLAGSSKINEWDIYGADTWHLSDTITIDAGFRHTIYEGHGAFRLTKATNLGNPATLADNAALGYTGGVLPTSIADVHTTWTAGVNWTASDALGFYARASRAIRGPSEFNLILPIKPTNTVATQYELGAKLRLPTLSVFATAFLMKFDPFTATLFATNPDGSQGFVNFVGSVKSPGVEVDFSWHPVSMFRLDGAVTYNNVKLGDFTSATGAQVVRANGNQPIRQPKIYGNIRPSLNFDIGGDTLEIFGRYNFVGKRFVDLENLTELPAYQTLGLGLTYQHGPLTLQVVGDNITNAHGITEGNPRSDQVSGQGSLTAIYGRPIFGRNVRASATFDF